MSAPGKPQAVLHETAGALDCFKLHNGHRFLIVGPGGCLDLSDWVARELHRWLGENLPHQHDVAAALDRCRLQGDAQHAMQEAAQKARADTAPWTSPRV